MLAGGWQETEDYYNQRGSPVQPTWQKWQHRYTYRLAPTLLSKALTSRFLWSRELTQVLEDWILLTDLDLDLEQLWLRLYDGSRGKLRQDLRKISKWKWSFYVKWISFYSIQLHCCVNVNSNCTQCLNTSSASSGNVENPQAICIIMFARVCTSCWKLFTNNCYCLIIHLGLNLTFKWWSSCFLAQLQHGYIEILLH